MNPHAVTPEAAGAIGEIPEAEPNGRAFLETVIGSSVVSTALRVAALGGITGSLFAASPWTVEPAAADSLASPQVPALRAGPHQPSAERHTASTSSHTGKEDTRCTQIVPFPGGYYFGKACSDDRIVKLGQSSSGNFSYGMLVMADGTDKCGYVKDGIVPTEQGPHKSADYCRQIARRILNPHSALKDLSCNPGDCSGGTPTTPTPKCKPEVQVYANFTTATRSPFNVYPTGKSGFVGLEGEQTNTISYRATVKQSSQVGPAAIVWGSKVDWGLTPQECVPLPVLINSHATNTSPPIKLNDFLPPIKTTTANAFETTSF